MWWNKWFVYHVIIIGTILFENCNTHYVENNKNEVTLKNNETNFPCYACKYKTVFDAIHFQRFVDKYDGKQQIMGFEIITFCLDITNAN